MISELISELMIEALSFVFFLKRFSQKENIFWAVLSLIFPIMALVFFTISVFSGNVFLFFLGLLNLLGMLILLLLRYLRCALREGKCSRKNHP
jgi:hypothetical protein